MVLLLKNSYNYLHIEYVRFRKIELHQAQI